MCSPSSPRGPVRGRRGHAARRGALQSADVDGDWPVAPGVGVGEPGHGHDCRRDEEDGRWWALTAAGPAFLSGSRAAAPATDAGVRPGLPAISDLFCSSVYSMDTGFIGISADPYSNSQSCRQSEPIASNERITRTIGSIRLHSVHGSSENASPSIDDVIGAFAGCVAPVVCQTLAARLFGRHQCNLLQTFGGSLVQHLASICKANSTVPKGMRAMLLDLTAPDWPIQWSTVRRPPYIRPISWLTNRISTRCAVSSSSTAFG